MPGPAGKTVVAMVTIGPDSWTRKYSVARARAYAERHGYHFEQITEPNLPHSKRSPHWEKILVPRALPGYDRWLVIDDDVLINTRLAPALPDVPAGCIGLVKEPISGQCKPPMEWLANSGVMLFDRGALDLLDAIYDLGELTGIEPGYGDQPAVNAAAWQACRVERLEWKWNYLLMADWLLTTHRQVYPWTKDFLLARWAKATLCAGLLRACLRPLADGPMARLRESYFVHLTWFRIGVRLVDRYLG